MLFISTKLLSRKQKMDSSESLKQFEMLEEDNIPPWAFAFFGKVRFNLSTYFEILSLF